MKIKNYLRNITIDENYKIMIKNSYLKMMLHSINKVLTDKKSIFANESASI